MDRRNGTKKQNGQLILEILIAVAVAAVVLGIGAQILVASLQGNKISGERDVAEGLLQEVSDAVRAVASEHWAFLYYPPSGSGDPATDKGSLKYYHAVLSGNAWSLASGTESVAVNGIAYTRYVTLDNVSRGATGDIELVYSAANDDPSTQKIMVTVSWSGADALSSAEYLTRWMNQLCGQSDWSGGATASVVPCASDVYATKDAAIDDTGGTLKLNPN